MDFHFWLDKKNLEILIPWIQEILKSGDFSGIWDFSDPVYLILDIRDSCRSYDIYLDVQGFFQISRFLSE